MRPSGSVAVVHLVRKSNGVAPLERFAASYRKYAAGMEHDLILIFKGFGGRREPNEYRRALEGISNQQLYLPDRGFDLAPYFNAAQRSEHRYFCFLNSFSRLVAHDWLAKLFRQLDQRGVGIVGATGSYQSFARGYAERHEVLRNLSRAARLRWRIRHVLSDPAPNIVAQRAGAWVLGAIGLWKPARHFPAFPNYHIRTNAFMTERETLLRIRLRPMWFKLSAFLMESGRDGVTAQVMRMGLRALVVDRHGRAFEKEDWHRANTFRQSCQEDVLVEDNQTDAYANADAAQRAGLSRAAWGEYARPA